MSETPGNSDPPGQKPLDVHIVSVAADAFAHVVHPLCVQSYFSMHGFHPPMLQHDPPAAPVASPAAAVEAPTASDVPADVMDVKE